jgi:hypothetical protein
VAQDAPPQVTITDITADTVIKGQAFNLPVQIQGKACVVVYVHTDVWYIHPYANAGLDKSFALIEPQGNQGNWKIQTIKREFSADKIAAMILKDTNGCEGVPARINDVTKIQNVLALQIYDLRGDKAGWYGSL